MRKLRLHEVIVQPVFVLDDGKTRTKLPAEPVTVLPEDWPTYPTTQFVEGFKALQKEYAGENRAARRGKASPKPRKGKPAT